MIILVSSTTVTYLQAGDYCAICMDDFDTSAVVDDGAYELQHCTGHAFHKTCIRQQLLLNGKCAMCSHIYCWITGSQPPNGTMTTKIYPGATIPLTGFHNVDTIVITYNFPNGIQGSDNPNPGSRYHGTSRVSYLPNNADGQELLKLFETCFKRRLTFTGENFLLFFYTCFFNV